MSWLSKLIDKVREDDSIDFVVTPALPLGSGAAKPESLPADACYVELRVAALRIPRTRRMSSTFYGVVHVFSTLARTGSKNVEIATILAPDKLAGVDPKHASNAVMLDKVVMGPIAWRGGNLDLEMGLFSVKSSDLAEPFISLITDIANTAGVSFVAAAAPFVPAIKKGMELLAGKIGDGSLEIGISRTLSQPTTGTFAVIGIGKTQIDMARLSVDPSDYRLLLDKEPVVNAPYLVFRLTKSGQRPDFGSIPELAEAYADLNAKVRAGVESPARDALNSFVRVVLTSPDLIKPDAETMIEKATAIVDKVFAGGPTAAKAQRVPKTLAEIGLYE